ncbi:hypothetical protein M436DRAFT_66990 [Aureobasidium namibiae CBS 147.97]|uniref:Uncharacterized protein n=1 Tax=Aureobasidium namibiae CBS 147.97 TaxID=1043004 RepID=A0A074W9G4_9PEZI
MARQNNPVNYHVPSARRGLLPRQDHQSKRNKSGAHFQVLLKTPLSTALVEFITVTAREWESCNTIHVPNYPNHQILGRIRNLDVELFGPFPTLEEELLSLDYTVRPFDRSKCMSIYADTELRDRTLLQKLQDQLYEALRDDGWDIAYGLVTETQADWVLVTKLDRVSSCWLHRMVKHETKENILTRDRIKERYNPENPCPPVLTAVGAEYNTIGYILDNDIFITAAEKNVKRFYMPHAPWVIYKLLDKTIATEYSRHLLEVKQEKQQQHKREKRRNKKMLLQKGKGTEQERQGALEASGKDFRVGGKTYRKHDIDEMIDVAAGTAEEDAEMKMQKLGITEVEQKTMRIAETGTDKRVGEREVEQKKDTQRKEEARKKEEVVKKEVWDTPWKKNSGVDEIRKPSWFFSGEDALKNG